MPRPIIWLLTVCLTIAGVAAAGAPASATGSGHITGRVTDVDGVPLGDVEVTALAICSCEGYVEMGTAHTAADGTYDLAATSADGFPYTADGYTLHFEGPGSDYAPEYFDDALSLDGATFFHVPDGGTATGMDAQLAPGGHITGTVTDLDGTPVSGASVTAHFSDPNTGGVFDEHFSTATAAGGRFDLSQLPASSYDLEFRAAGYRTQWYPTGVVVASGATVAGRNVRLSDGRRVTNLRPPAITKKPRVGHKVTARPGSWTPRRVTVTYRWVVAGRPVPGATHASYRPRPANAGKRLRVRVTATAPGYTRRTVMSAARTVMPRR